MQHSIVWRQREAPPSARAKRRLQGVTCTRPRSSCLNLFQKTPSPPRPGPACSYRNLPEPRAQEGARSCCLSPVDGADTRHSVIVTNAFCQEPVPDLPSKHGRVLPFVVPYLLHHLRGGHLGLGAPYHSRPDAASLVVPTPIENPPKLPDKQVGPVNRGLGRVSVPSESPEERCGT